MKTKQIKLVPGVAFFDVIFAASAIVAEGTPHYGYHGTESADKWVITSMWISRNQMEPSC
ncbi:MAG: hypothetical protein ABI583_06525 [Betaproteobacteria bacterium]